MNSDLHNQRLGLSFYKKFIALCLLVILSFGTTPFPILADTVPSNSNATAPIETTPNRPDNKLAPVINLELPNRIPNQYIVVFKPGTTRDVVLATQKRVKELGGKIGNTYESALVGFSVNIPEGALQTLRTLPGVAYIEADQMGSIETIWNQPPDIPTPPPTGLDRITDRLLPLNNLYTYDGQGAGVHAYVIDTGIRTTHSEFTGRIAPLAQQFAVTGTPEDCNGHGTHVAGTIGGTTYGVAKQVTLHPVRVVNDCTGNVPASNILQGINWVTANAILPAVANISIGFGTSVTINSAVATSIASGITYVVSAGNSNVDACTASPASEPTAITVGAIDPVNDNRSTFAGSNMSNFGPCVDLFAPGSSILSAGITNDTATATKSGTSMAAPHVAGVAARYLASFPLKTPAEVWAQIDLRASQFGTTPGWPGITNPGVGSPNKLLFWGAVNDAFDDGDPHISTVNGIHYDFQNGGEFVALRDANGTEIQTRQTPVPTAPWVSVNTAIAARVGQHRVTWQPNLSGIPDLGGLQLRVDGILTSIGENGLDLGPGARISKSVGNGIEISFPDGTTLIATSNWWGSQSQWYINVHVFHSPATEGIMGTVAPNSWSQEQFADTWRVTEKTSLFDYASSQSTKTFTLPDFPKENIPPMKPENVTLAQKVCAEIIDENMKGNCIFDVSTTGDPIFAKSYLTSQMIIHEINGKQSSKECPKCPEAPEDKPCLWPW